MSGLVRRRLPPGRTMARISRDHPGATYDAYVPDPLVGRPVELDHDALIAVAEAERALTALKETVAAAADAEANAFLVLPRDALVAPNVGALVAGRRRVLRAEAARAFGCDADDPIAENLIGTVGDITRAVETLVGAKTITVDGLLELHRHTLDSTEVTEHGGQVRTTQAWFGGRAPRVGLPTPPPADVVGELLDDLCAFANDTELPAVVAAALVHLQLQTIHPFVDGNGRASRMLTHVIFRRRGLALDMVPAMRPVLVPSWDAYVGALTAARYVGQPESDASQTTTSRWITYFAAVCHQAVAEAAVFAFKLERIRDGWRTVVTSVQSGGQPDL